MKVFWKNKIESKLVPPIVLLLASFLWCGGYYEYCTVIIGVVAAFLTWLGSKKRQNILCENYLFFAMCLAFFYIFASIYATDSGMALSGAAKKSVILLFALVIACLTVEQRCRLLQGLPEMAIVTIVVGALGAMIPVIRPYVIAAGRFCGTFGYANTYALFLFLSLLILLETDLGRSSWWRFGIGSVLLIALWFTGSRYTWILAVFILIIYAVGQKKVRKWAICLLAVLGVATIAAATIFRQSEAMGRLFSTNLSTLYGRILYWQDAWQLVRKHPFGMGYLGYYYEQTQIQTGVYTVRYVHNDLLQWILDIGWIPMLILLLLVGFALCNRKRPFAQKILLVTLLLHSCMEFDFEHTAIAFLWILVLSATEESIRPKKKNKKKDNKVYDVRSIFLPDWVGKVMAVVLGCLCLYFAVPLSLYAMGKMEAAVTCYPIYTDAQLALLSLEEDEEEADEIADAVLKQNDTAFLAYDAKAQVAFQNGEFEDMVRYKKCAIARNKYNANEYVDYLMLLNEVLAYSQEQSDMNLQEKMITEMEQLLILIQKNEAEVSELGKRIDDKVEIALPEDIVEQIQNLRSND